MKFGDHKAIYLQIEDYIAEKILTGEWKPKDRLLSIREMAILLEVNPNTVARTYLELEAKNIIYKQRGIGYFIAKDARQNALELERQEFIKVDLPKVFKMIKLLNMNISELNKLYEEKTNEN
jgi:GntR family transcriptional regulator